MNPLIEIMTLTHNSTHCYHSKNRFFVSNSKRSDTGLMEFLSERLVQLHFDI